MWYSSYTFPPPSPPVRLIILLNYLVPGIFIPGIVLTLLCSPRPFSGSLWSILSVYEAMIRLGVFSTALEQCARAGRETEMGVESRGRARAVRLRLRVPYASSRCQVGQRFESLSPNQ